MPSILVHIHSGPELKNKLTLGLLVAVTGVKEGHTVKLFLAADAVHALNCKAEGENYWRRHWRCKSTFRCASGS